MDFHAEQLSNGIDLMTARHATHCRAGPATIFLQMIEGQREHLVWSEPGSIAINDAKAIGIAVEAEAKLRFTLTDELPHFGHAFGVGFRMMSSEERVELVVKPGNGRAGVREQFVQVTATSAVHEFDRDFEAGFFDSGEIDELANLFKISGLRVEGFALVSANHGGFERPVLLLEACRLR